MVREATGTICASYFYLKILAHVAPSRPAAAADEHAVLAEVRSLTRSSGSSKEPAFPRPARRPPAIQAAQPAGPPPSQPPSPQASPLSGKGPLWHLLGRLHAIFRPPTSGPVRTSCPTCCFSPVSGPCDAAGPTRTVQGHLPLLGSLMLSRLQTPFCHGR